MAGVPPAWAEVALSVYQLHGTSGINFITDAAGLGGAYHVGVEVYGLEWSFGGADQGTGIYMVHIGKSTLGNFMERVSLGRTRKTPDQVIAILDEYRRTWRGNQYHLLAKNCASFSISFTSRLGVQKAPDWVNALAGFGAGVFGSEADNTVQVREEENCDIFDDDELEEMAEDGDHIAMLELAWRSGKEYTFEWVDQQKHNARTEDLMVEFRFSVRRDDTKGRNAAIGVMGNPRLKDAIAEATAKSMGLEWDRSTEHNTCPVKVHKLETLSGLRVATKMRVTGGDNINKTKAKISTLKPEVFEESFKPALKTATNWPQQQKAILETLQLDTAPGQPAVSHRVITASRKPGGGGEAQKEMLFPRKEFKTPDSVGRTLAKLEGLRQRVQEQSVVHKTLNAMQRPCAAPWWAK